MYRSNGAIAPLPWNRPWTPGVCRNGAEMGMIPPISATNPLLWTDAVQVPIPVHVRNVAPDPENPAPSKEGCARPLTRRYSGSSGWGCSRTSGHHTKASAGLDSLQGRGASRDAWRLSPATSAGHGPGPAASSAPAAAVPAHVTQAPRVHFLQYNHCNKADKSVN